MPSQTLVVNSGVDAGDNGNPWTNPTFVVNNDGTNYAQCTIASGTSNTLKCKFNAAAFSIPTDQGLTGIQINFKAFHSQGVGTASSVKITLGASTLNQANNTALTGTVATYTFGGPSVDWEEDGAWPSPAQVNGAWEIDLQFTGPGTIEIQDVSATIYYAPVSPSVPRRFSPSDVFGNGIFPPEGDAVFKRGFAATPVPTPLIIWPRVVGLPQGSEALASLFIGGASFRSGFAPSLPVTVPAYVASNADRDFWTGGPLLAGAWIARVEVPFNTFPAVPQWTVQTVSSPLPGNLFEGLAVVVHGSLPGPSPFLASQLVVSQRDADLPLLGLDGSAIFGRGRLGAATPILNGPESMVIADTSADPIIAREGRLVRISGFAAAFIESQPPTSVVVGWPATELQSQWAGSTIAQHGFSAAPPVVWPTSHICSAIDPDPLPAGSVICFHGLPVAVPPPPPPSVQVIQRHEATDLAPAGAVVISRGFFRAPSPNALVSIVAAMPGEGDLPAMLSAGSSIAALRGFAPATAQPIVSSAVVGEPLAWSPLLAGAMLAAHGFSPPPPVGHQAATVVQAGIDLDWRLFAGDLVSTRGNLPNAPTLTTISVIASPIDHAWLAGSASFSAGRTLPAGFDPGNTTFVRGAVDVEFLRTMPAGSVIVGHTLIDPFASVPPKVIAAESAPPVVDPSPIFLNVKWGAPRVPGTRGIVAAESEIPQPFGGGYSFSRPRIDATPAARPAASSVVFSGELSAEWLGGRSVYSAGRDVIRAAMAPRGVVVGFDDAPWCLASARNEPIASRPRVDEPVCNC